jgi:uncharacterized protein YeaO (DUF488 family)
MTVQIRRVYEAAARERGDGRRVLVDRLWPRGMSKDRLAIDVWMKEIAPSPELRRWYGHRPARFEAFAARYREELRSADRRADLAELRRVAARGRLTLLTATKDVDRSAAAVLMDVIDRRGQPTGQRT